MSAGDRDAATVRTFRERGWPWARVTCFSRVLGPFCTVAEARAVAADASPETAGTDARQAPR